MSTLRTFLLALLAFASVAAQEDIKGKDGWSEPVKGLQARVTFGEGELFHGTRIARVYLELHNTTNNVGALAFDFDWRNSIHLEMHTADGKPAPTGPGFFGGMVTGVPTRLAIPFDGTLKFALDYKGYGVNPDSGTFFGFHPVSDTPVWLIPKGDSHEYFLDVTLAIPHDKNGNGVLWEGTIKLPTVKVPVEK